MTTLITPLLTLHSFQIILVIIAFFSDHFGQHYTPFRPILFSIPLISDYFIQHYIFIPDHFCQHCSLQTLFVSTIFISDHFCERYSHCRPLFRAPLIWFSFCHHYIWFQMTCVHTIPFSHHVAHFKSRLSAFHSFQITFVIVTLLRPFHTTLLTSNLICLRHIRFTQSYHVCKGYTLTNVGHSDLKWPQWHMKYLKQKYS